MVLMLFNVFVLVVLAFLVCGLLNSAANHALRYVTAGIGIALVAWGLSDPALASVLNLEEIVSHKRSRSTLYGIGCITGTICNLLSRKR